MLKLNFGVSGQGNMKVRVSSKDWDSLSMKAKKVVVEESLDSGHCFNIKMTHFEFFERIVLEGAVVEEFVQGEILDSPSAQVFVSPMGVELISTHRQILDDKGQKFVGGEYPCLDQDKQYISGIALEIGESLKSKKVYGVTSIDFLVAGSAHERNYFVIELNIRKGGTTHPFMLSNIALRSDRYYNNGQLKGEDNRDYIYRSNDNFYPNRSLFKTEKSLINKVAKSGVLFCQKNKRGVVFHLLNSYEDIGKIGYTVIGKNKAEIDAVDHLLKQVLTGQPCRKLSIVGRSTLH